MRRLNWSVLCAVGLLTVLGACATETPAPADGQNSLGSGLSPGGTCDPAIAVIDCMCPDGRAGRAVCSPVLQAYSACGCDGVVPMQQVDQIDPMTMASQSGLPCDVASVLEDHCWTCHGTTLQYTAPMRLVTWEDLQAGTPSNPAVPVYQTLLARVQHPNAPMPPAPNARLDTTQIGVLQSWVNGGAVKGPDVCTDTGTAGGGPVDPIVDAAVALPDDVECFDFFANNGGGSAGAPFDVPSTPDYYHCFNFKAPWTGDVHGIRSMSVVDNTASVHHWILYSASGVNADAKGGTCSGQHANGQFVVGWAPGANDMEMPDGVGLQIPKTGFQLEIHYNAPSAGQKDKSGVKLCVTKALRANTAAVHPLGQEWPLQPTSGAGDIVGTCKPKGPFPITIISSSPHMHKKGTHMKTVINRANGTKENLIDMPFDFNTQLAYPTPMQINQGDTLTTTCTYSSGVQYGTSTTQEMCYDFVTAYPAGALSGGGGFSNNGNNCIEGGF